MSRRHHIGLRCAAMLVAAAAAGAAERLSDADMDAVAAGLLDFKVTVATTNGNAGGDNDVAATATIFGSNSLTENKSVKIGGGNDGATGGVGGVNGVGGTFGRRIPGSAVAQDHGKVTVDGSDDVMMRDQSQTTAKGDVGAATGAGATVHIDGSDHSHHIGATNRAGGDTLLVTATGDITGHGNRDDHIVAAAGTTSSAADEVALGDDAQQNAAGLVVGTSAAESGAGANVAADVRDARTLLIGGNAGVLTANQAIGNFSNLGVASGTIEVNTAATTTQLGGFVTTVVTGK